MPHRTSPRLASRSAATLAAATLTAGVTRTATAGLSAVAILLVVAATTAPAPLAAQDVRTLQESAWAEVDARAGTLTGLSDGLWRTAETSLREHESSAMLADHLEEEGLTGERGVADMPTAFVARWGSGSPVIGILAEFDALPGISNVARPERRSLVEGGAGHGCGHNLFGAGSVGAAIALAAMAIAITAYTPVASSFVVMLAPEARRGVYLSVNSMCWAIGYFIGPPLGGWALDQAASVTNGFWLGAALSVLVVIGVLAYLNGQLRLADR